MRRTAVLAALCFTISGCGSEIDDTQAALTDASAAEVNAVSDVLKIPDSVGKSDYVQFSFQDTSEYVHFRAPREIADSFAKGFLGFVPTDTEKTTIRSGELEQAWWPKGPVPGARFGRENRHPNGVREVLIRDGSGDSEVWAFYSSPGG